jgi:autotransporter adhesin
VEATVSNVSNLSKGQAGLFQVSADNTAAPTASGKNATAGGASAVASGANSTAIGSNAKATASNAVALGSGSVATRDNSVSVGSAGHERQVTNVAAGTQTTDAANFGQVQDALVTAKRYTDSGDQSTLSSANAYTDAKLTGFTTTGDFNAFRDQVNQQFHTVNTRLDRVGAMGSAMAGMAGAIASAPNTQNRISAAVGGYGGQGALAVGYSYRLPGNGAVLVGGSIAGGGESSGTVGMSFGW